MTDVEAASEVTKPLLSSNVPTTKQTKKWKPKHLFCVGTIFALIGFSGLCCGSTSAGLELIEGPIVDTSGSSLQKKIKPFKPLHHARFVYYTSSDETGKLSYRREFTAPCNYGILVFNIGPAAEQEPYSYEVYQDAYVFSDNKGLCFIYPSYKGVQTGDFPFWKMTDATEGNVGLGDDPNRISTRVVIEPKTKEMDATQGGDYLIVRQGNFFSPGYNSAIRRFVHSLNETDNVDQKMEEFLGSL